MKKQILLISCSLLINFFVPCKGSEKPKSWQIAHLIGNSTEEGDSKYKACPSAPSRKIADLLAEPTEDQKPSPSVTNETLASFFQRAQKGTSPVEETTKQELDLDPTLILIPFNNEAKTLTLNMNACAYGLDENRNLFLQRHSTFEEKIDKVYVHYLAEKRKAKICIASPSFHTLVLRTQGMIQYIRETKIRNDAHKITFEETVKGLLGSLLEAKERVKKN